MYPNLIVGKINRGENNMLEKRKMLQANNRLKPALNRQLLCSVLVLALVAPLANAQEPAQNGSVLMD